MPDLLSIFLGNPLLLVGCGVLVYLYFNRTDTDGDGNPEFKNPVTGKSVEVDSKSLDAARAALTGIGAGFLSELIGFVQSGDSAGLNAKAQQIADDLKDANVRRARLLPIVESHVKDVGQDRGGLNKLATLVENEKKNIADEANRLSVDQDLRAKS
ncbi:MAG: hypothetical protein ACKVH8_14155 [Pirellulales bacterium]|jgi:hypothetical protein